MTQLISSDQWMFPLMALAINMLASFTMCHMLGHTRLSRPLRRYWLLSSAFVYGLGLWVSQLIMLFATDTMLLMDWSSVAKLLAMVTAYFALRSLRTMQPLFVRLLISGLLITLGHVVLNYGSLLSSQVVSYKLEHGMAWIGVALSFIGVIVGFGLFERHRGAHPMLSGFILGLLGFLAQYFSIESITANYSFVLTTDKLSDYTRLLVVFLGVATSLIFAFSLLAHVVDQRFSMMNERYRLLVENSIDMIAMIREDRWEYVNRSGLAMFEAKSDQDLLDQSIYHYLHPKCHETMRTLLQRVEKNRYLRPVEMEWYTVKGRPFFTEVVQTRTRFAGKPAYQVIIRDISERKKNEELLINSEKLYVAGQLAAGIAHEIRNPLTSLKGFLQLIASGRQGTKNYFDIMKSELTRIESIVSELLMLSKPQVYEYSYKDIRTVMRDTIMLLEAQALLHSIELEAEFGEDPLWVHGVEDQLKQVFINVLKNAIEVMIDGGKILVSGVREDDQVVVRIQDFGPGIPQETMAKIGQPFYTTKDKGTGLGLMVSYKIVDNHQGRVDVQTKIGRGTTFAIILPYMVPPGNENGEESHAAPQVSPTLLHLNKSGE
ncbi:PAS domain S-box-containing protein [Paenibacillus phyllosphaerae]|uniref:histidine kinase n=1 Tax=Paenibacillus phyllosphaerae TaxID=274593 RepID=A0A7W5B1H7_9BACL|nr:ATP-binding protein [Paenibacillus phyllosphaerae]MBB3112683.1 PAS domain S-box-containing protein [Paenibacillus phyllosphaerae]